MSHILSQIKSRRAWVLVFAVGVTSVVLACSGSDGGPSELDDDVASVSVSPGQAQLTSIGETVQLTATARTADGGTVSGVSFSWSSSNTAAATVSSTGTVTARGRGSAVITASTEGVQGTAQVAVTLEVASVSVSPSSAELTALNQTVQLQAQARTAEGDPIPGLSVGWTSSAPGVASVNGQGLVTAVGNGPAMITATIEGVTGTASITVAQSLESVVVTPATASTSPGGQVQFSAEGQDANGFPVPDLSFTWMSTNTAAATVDQNGLATGVADGSTVIEATAEGLTGSAVLTVTRAVAGVEVTPPQAQLDAIGATAQFSATATDDEGQVIEGVAFTWSSTNGNVASVSATGLATATGNGTTQIRAEADGITGSAELTVDQVTTSVDVSPGSASATVGETVQFTATARDANGNEVNDATFQWSSSNEAAATVDQNGLATAVAEGSAEIQATAEGVTGSATLTVSETGGQIRAVSGDEQNGKTQRDFADPLVVEVLDPGGNPEAGVTVTWSVVEGDATLSSTSVQTDAQGRAAVTLTAGTELTSHRIQASATDRDGSPVEFTAQTTVLVAVIGDNFFEDLQGRRNANFQVTVSVGDTIEFLYEGGAVVHTATSDTEPEGGNAFDSGQLQPGESFRFVPNVVGTWVFLCEIHPSIMRDAEIVVN